MSKEQIYEMAKDICLEKQNCNDVCNPDKSCTALKYAERAYEQGYRKQAWISVDERLPEENGKYIVFRKTNGIGYIDIISYDKNYKEFGFAGASWCTFDADWGDYRVFDVTHWMPLPEAPRKEDEGK